MEIISAHKLGFKQKHSVSLLRIHSKKFSQIIWEVKHMYLCISLNKDLENSDQERKQRTANYEIRP